MGRIAKLGTKFYDLGTSNRSFIQLAKDLKMLKIKNCYFMLEINDISLIKIDPHACDQNGHTTLSKDQIERVVRECCINPWYFLREIVRIPDPGGNYVRYLANRGNIAQAWCMYHNLDSWLCLPRQTGKTMSSIAYMTWCYIFGTTNSQFIFVNKDGDNAKANLLRMRNIINNLPEYMRCASITDSDGKTEKAKDNATSIANPVTKNSVITKPKATSKDSALSLARGLSAPVLAFDEPEFTNHIKTIIANSVSTYETAARRAKANGGAAYRVMTCTPGDLDTNAGVESQQILDKTVKWSEHLYDMTIEEVEGYIEGQGDDCNKILYIEYSYKQIGLTETWFKNIAAKIGDRITVRREILLQRIHGSSLSPFNQEDVDYIVQCARKPIDELWLLSNYKFDIYTPLDRGKPYLVGVDCSTGTGGDNNAITIIDPATVEPVAEFECSFIGETKYEELLKELVKYLPRAVLCIEKNSIGDGIIDHLLHSPIGHRLYYDRAKDLVEDKAIKNQTVESMLKKQATIKTYYGVYTSSASRDDMMAILARHVCTYKEKFVTHNITRDLSRLVRTKSGKIEAGDGHDENNESFHDDSVMSYLIALYVYYHGNNLAVFGIYPGMMEESEFNTGLKHADEADPTLVSQSLINSVKEIEAKEQVANKELEWEDILRKSVTQAQKNTYQMYRNNMVNNTVFENSAESSVEEYDDVGEIPLSFFSEINK